MIARPSSETAHSHGGLMFSTSSHVKHTVELAQLSRFSLSRRPDRYHNGTDLRAGCCIDQHREQEGWSGF